MLAWMTCCRLILIWLAVSKECADKEFNATEPVKYTLEFSSFIKSRQWKGWQSLIRLENSWSSGYVSRQIPSCLLNGTPPYSKEACLMAFVCMTKKILPQTSKHHFSKSKGYHGLQGLLEAPLWSGALGLLHSLLTHKALLLSVAFGASGSKEVNKPKNYVTKIFIVQHKRSKWMWMEPV